MAAAGDDDTADFIAEVKIDTSDFATGAAVAVEASTSPDTSWK